MMYKVLHKTTVVSVLIAMLLGCIASDEELLPISIPIVRVITPVQTEYTPHLESFGTISFLRKADVRPETEGEIVALIAEESDTVVQNGSLARLDTSQLEIRLQQVQADVDSATSSLNLAREQLAEGRRQVEARLISADNAQLDVTTRQRAYEKAEENYNDSQQLYDAGGLSAGDLDEAEDRWINAEIALERAKNELALQMIGLRDKDLINVGATNYNDPQSRIEALIELNTATLRAQVDVAEAAVQHARAEETRVLQLIESSTVRAPIAGIVASRYQELGERASPDQPLFTVIDASQVYADLQISETELGRISVGRPATVVVESLASVLQGTVARISPVLSSETRSGRVRILLPAPDQRLRPGMFATVKIQTGNTQNVLALPISTITEAEDGSRYVYTVESGIAFRTPIDVGPLDNEHMAVLQGISPTNTVVVTPSDTLRDGMRVEVQR